MNKKIKTKWLKALRSGKFKQGQNQLMIPKGEPDAKGRISRKHNRFCCLGVLQCVVNDSKTITGSRAEQGFPSRRTDTRSKLDSTHVPGVYGSISEYLTELNDGGHSFKRIANWIEKNL